MNNLMHAAWAKGKINFAFIIVLVGFLFFQMPTLHAQTQDTTWYTPVAPVTSWLSFSSFSVSTSSSGAVASYSPPIHLAYRMPVMVDDVLIDQIAGSNLNFTYTWFANSWFNQLDIYISGISNADLQDLLIGIVITIDDIRGSEVLSFKQLDIQELSMNAYPNPSRGEFNLDIQGNESQPMTLKILDLQGRSVLIQTINPVNEFLTVPVSLEAIQPGSYWLYLQGSSQVIKPIQVIR